MEKGAHEVKRFRKTLGTHEAVQFLGHNIEEMVEFTRGLARATAFPNTMFLSGVNGHCEVRVSDVVVKDPQGGFHRYSEASFNAIFEEVPE